MKKMEKWFLHASAVALLAGASSVSYASNQGPWDGGPGGGVQGLLCLIFHVDCPTSGGGGWGDPSPRSVPEPGMLGLFGASAASAAIAAYRRRRRK